MQQGRLDPGIEPFVLQKAALRAFEQTGDPQVAAKRAVETFAEPSGVSTGDETLTGGSGRDEILLAQGRPRGAKTPGEVNSFFNERWEEDDEAFADEAAKFGLNPDRALLLRDILKAAQNGMTEEEKAALLERTKGRPIGFRRLINSLTVGDKKGDARKIAGVISFKDLAEEDRTRTGAEVGIELLDNLPGRPGKPRRRPGATQGGSSSRNKKRENPEDEFGVKLPDKSVTKNPMTKAEFGTLKESGEIDPNRIRTMQDTIDKDFKDGRSLERMVRELLDGTGGPVEKIRIAVIGKHVFTLDHRRLIAHRLAGKRVQYRKATQDEVDESLGGKRSKNSTLDTGMSVRILER